jgi:sigma-B regulation protein RsbU (phosphoserine phosphatase)
LYFFTDGIPEAENPAGEQFGVDRVLEILAQNRDLALEETLSSLMQCVGEWTAPGSPADDASLLAIERSG